MDIFFSYKEIRFTICVDTKNNYYKIEGKLNRRRRKCKRRKIIIFYLLQGKQGKSSFIFSDTFM